MKKIWIIGAGRFGCMAADRLTGKIKDPDLVLVDLKAEKLHEAEGPGRTLIEADGAAYLAENLPTGKPRKRNMFELLGEIHFPPWESLVIRSHQLGPGIGGYRVRELYELADRIEKARGPILLGTACRCHGIVTGLQLDP